MKHYWLTLRVLVEAEGPWEASRIGAKIEGSSGVIEVIEDDINRDYDAEGEE